MDGAQAQVLIAGLAIFLIGIGLVVSRLPVAECAECQHCRALRIARRVERELETEQRLRRTCSVDRCPRCGGFHPSGGPQCQ